MNNEVRPQHPNRNESPARLVFFFLALTPVPLGLLTIDPEHSMRLITEPKQQWSSYEYFFAMLTVVFCIIGCAGLLYGRGRKNWEMIAMGVVVGLLLAFVEAYIMAFFGCCYVISRI